MLPIVAGLSACLIYIFVVSLHGKLVDYKHMIYLFFVTVILSLGTSAFYSFFEIHNLIKEILPFLVTGLYLQPLTQSVSENINLSANRGDEGGRNNMSAIRWRREGDQIIRQLNELTNTTNNEIDVLNYHNLRFEHHYDDVQRYRLAGDQANETHSADLARSHRSGIQRSLSTIDRNMANINSITRHAANLLDNRARNNISPYGQETINIGRTLANNPMYNI